MRASLSAILLAILAVPSLHAQNSTPPIPILARDVDSRPLPPVTQAALSPAMRKAVAALFDPELPPGELKIYRIPIAPHDHKLYFVEQRGPHACAGNGPNCPQSVLDETASGVRTVVDGGGVGISVVRRPALAMPDIAAFEQEGHFATSTTVYRFDGKAWHTYLCKLVSPIGSDPTPRIVADQPCPF